MKRQRERQKQQQQLAKAARRRERSAAKKNGTDAPTSRLADAPLGFVLPRATPPAETP